MDGTDTVDGGKGIDLYDASGASSDVLINLDNVAHSDVSSIAANAAQGNQISGGFVERDTVTGFENASGGAGHDGIFGNSSANVLMGNGSFDGLFGLDGNDQLFGGVGADALVGGKGADILSGGGLDGAGDAFIYQSLSDSTVTKSGRDTITDFEFGPDKIDLGASWRVAGGGGATPSSLAT